MENKSSYPQTKEEAQKYFRRDVESYIAWCKKNLSTECEEEEGIDLSTSVDDAQARKNIEERQHRINRGKVFSG
jgi:RIO-like serine/threonine protein kinase